MKRKNKWFWISPLIFGISVLAIIRLVSDVPKESKFWERSLSKNLIEFVSIIIISFAIEYSLQNFIRRRKKKAKQLTFKNLASEYLFIITTDRLNRVCL
jgi:two-component system LytT family sensor kinase